MKALRCVSLILNQELCEVHENVDWRPSKQSYTGWFRRNLRDFEKW